MLRSSTVVENNCDFVQMDLPLDLELGKGGQVLKRTRLESVSTHNAWYELFLIYIPRGGGFLIEKISGASKSGRQREIWFRQHHTEAEKKYENIVKDKTNPNRRSPRKYQVVTEFSNDGMCMAA